MIRQLLSLAIVAGVALVANAAGPYQSPVQSPYQGPVQGPVQAPSYAPTKTVVCSLPVCDDRCIDYKHLRPRCEPCGPRYETVLFPKDNCCCCLVEVPVCLPTCAVGQPAVCHKGNHVTLYTWDSGYTVRVIVARNGRVIVHYNA